MLKIVAALVLIFAIACEAHGHGGFGHGGFGHGGFGHGGFGHRGFGHGFHGHSGFGHGGSHGHGGFHGHHHGGFGGRFFRAIQSVDSHVAFDCFFHWRNETLHCQHLTKPTVVDCHIESTIKEKVNKYWTQYAGFAIGKDHFHADKKIHDVVDDHFHLFPRSKSTSTWLNTTLSSGVHLSIYHKATPNFVGYRVTDLSCWTKLVGLFTLGTKFDTITIAKVAKPVEILGYINY